MLYYIFTVLVKTLDCCGSDRSDATHYHHLELAREQPRRTGTGTRREGKPGSGLLYRFTETAPVSTRTVVHAIALDDAISLDHWVLQTKANLFTLTNGQKKWTLAVQDEAANQLSLISGHGRRWDIRHEAGQYTLNRMPDYA
jgi:hypothetical protein